MIKSTTTLIFLTIFSLNTMAQNFKHFKPDNDTIYGVIILDCRPENGKRSLDSDKMNYTDSLRCLKIEHIPLENSNKVLCIERNFFGDTLGIGLKKEVAFNKKNSTFFTRNVDRLNQTGTGFGDKIGDWWYYHPDGSLIEIKEYLN